MRTLSNPDYLWGYGNRASAKRCPEGAVASTLRTAHCPIPQPEYEVGSFSPETTAKDKGGRTTETETGPSYHMHLAGFLHISWETCCPVSVSPPCLGLLPGENSQASFSSVLWHLRQTNHGAPGPLFTFSHFCCCMVKSPFMFFSFDASTGSRCG